MNATPQDVTVHPHRSSPPRPTTRRDAGQHPGQRLRHRSRQREQILEWLRGVDTHPTAAEIHSGLGDDLPTLSLGTVYRNLEILVADGAIEEVASGVGATRYDGNVEPHHHFHCEACHTILDIELAAPRGLAKRLEERTGLVSKRLRMNFFGLCLDCEALRNR